MPLFGMLFRVGFALLYDKLSATFEAPRRLYRRRLVFLAGFGLLHALLLYFGDITLAYAIAGFVAAAPRRQRCPAPRACHCRLVVVRRRVLLIAICRPSVPPPPTRCH